MKLTRLIVSILLTAVLLAGCMTSPQLESVNVETAVVSESAAASEVQDLLIWSIDLLGKTDGVFSSSDLLDQNGNPAHKETISVEVKGLKRDYTGIPLYMVLAMVDGEKEQHPFTFDWEAWKTGYEVTVTAADGYSAAFLSSDYNAKSTIIAYLEDGEPINPMLIGTELTKDLWVKNTTGILLSMEAVEKVVPTLTVTGSDSENIFSINELMLTPYYIEERGGYTTSAGTYYESLFGGVRLYDLLSSFGTLVDDGAVTVVASDGYEMSYSIADLKDTSEGVWIAAFMEDGKQMELDPGYFRIIKVGNPVPNIDGHSSAKMVKEIQFSAIPLKDFNLVISGKMEANVDRATMQAGINCTAHNTDVEYFNKKTGEVEYYTGIPLFQLLAFADDPDFAPHKQTDRSITAYDEEAARNGYKDKIIAEDGYSIELDSRELDGNQDVIIAMYQNDEELAGGDWPLKLVWNQNAEISPEGI
nr:hypothetical protein [Spirochaetota bacterium]